MFYSKKPTKYCKPAKIVGYEPVNMIKQNNQILCKHFVVLNFGEDKSFLKGPLVLEVDPDYSQNVFAYYA